MKNERAAYLATNALLLLAALFLTLAMNACMTYQKALRKFGHLATDSTTLVLHDTLRIPADSVVLRLRTDTTTVHRIIEQGRARIIYDRTRTQTIIRSECRPDTIVRTLTVKAPPTASFGIAPWYRTAFYLCLVLLIAATIAYLLLYQYQLNIALRKRP